MSNKKNISYKENDKFIRKYEKQQELKKIRISRRTE